MDYRVKILRGWLFVIGLALFVAFGPGEWPLFVYSLVPLGMMFTPVGLSTPTAGNCANCQTGTTTGLVQVVVAGVANDSCEECESVNGTWIGVQTLPCQYDFAVPQICGDSPAWAVTMNWLGGLFDSDGPRFQIRFNGLNAITWHIGDLTVPYDCSVGYNLPPDDNGTQPCDHSSSSVVITPL